MLLETTMARDVAELVTKIAASVAAVYPIARWVSVRAWRPVASHFNGVHRMVAGFDTMQGEISAIKSRIDAELGTNGGGSIKDQVTLIAARQEAIFDAQNRPSFQADAHGNFSSVNRAFERRTGFPARDLLGKGWVSLLHPDDVEDFMEVWAHMVKDGRRLRRSCRIVTADGTTVAISVNATPVKRKGTAVAIEWQGDFDGFEMAGALP